MMMKDSFKNTEPVKNWMTEEVITIQSTATVKDAFDILNSYTIFGIPVIDQENNYLGLMSKTVIMNNLSDSSIFYKTVTKIMVADSEVIYPHQTIEEAANLEGGCLPVINHQRKLLGIITRTDIIKANTYVINKAKEEVNYVETLDLVLNLAYEGIVVINNEGEIQEINHRYCQLINRTREEMIGCQVEDVIENTRLHVVIKTGVEERGRIQRINGIDLVVHRIPIFRNNDIVGAVGMLIFKDISEMQQIYTEANLKQIEDTYSHDFHHILDQIMGDSRPIIEAKKRAKKAAACSSNVFLSGKSGTGKEVFARAIHDMSSFSKGKFVCVNCSAIPDSLLESELFGYEEGSFTDAKKGGKLGKFEIAENGTIFLDEIGDMPLNMQAKLLRVIQERTIEKIGSTEQKKVNVRIISATHRDLKTMMKKGEFREDLYYRINVIPIHLSDLKERKEDIPMFVKQNIHRYCEKFSFEEKILEEEAMNCLITYSWPGNIRELINVCESMVVMSDGPTLTIEDLPLEIVLESQQTETSLTPIEKNEKEMIQELLHVYKGNKTAVAKHLELSRNTLYEKLKKYRI